MTNAQFLEFRRELCLALSIENTDAMIETGLFELDGIGMGAFFDDSVQDAIHCFVDLGPLDEVRRAARNAGLNISFEESLSRKK